MTAAVAIVVGRASRQQGGGGGGIHRGWGCASTADHASGMRSDGDARDFGGRRRRRRRHGRQGFPHYSSALSFFFFVLFFFLPGVLFDERSTETTQANRCA